MRTQIGKGIRVISLFAGAGGLDLGFDLTGYDVVYATDWDAKCCETLKLNLGKTLSSDTIIEQADIRELDLQNLPKDIDLVIGGPPCQSFSASGRRAGGASGCLDERGTLFEAYCKIINHTQPKAFLFENVRGILGTNKGEDWKNIVSSFKEIGYVLNYRILDALDYGAPQQRERMILVGHKSDDKEFLFPRPLFGPDSLDSTPHITSEEALKNIKNETEDKEALILQNGKYAHLLPLVPPGENYLYFTAKRGYENPIFAYRSRFSDFLYKANPKSPIKTLIASPGKYTGPFHWENRCFTISEYKRLQGFPDEYLFVGDRTDQIRQIGNSVSPKLSYQLAKSIANQIFDRKVDIDLLPKDYALSFDSRKGKKAANTKKIHTEIARQQEVSYRNMFVFSNYESRVLPVDNFQKNNVSVKTEGKTVDIKVRTDSSRKLYAKIQLEIFQNEEALIRKEKEPEAILMVSVYGEADHSIQTMWNAIDSWVIKSSNFHSLFELYGHFTEPHPIFKIVHFENISPSPIAAFAKHIADFKNCSTYFLRKHLTDLFGVRFGTNSFIDLVNLLRGYRFDIRCIETNAAMPDDVYMVSYPFTLPHGKQMNFSVKPEFSTQNNLMETAIKPQKKAKKNQEVPQDNEREIITALDKAYTRALNDFNSDGENYNLSNSFRESLDKIASSSQKASTGFTNIMTCLAIKSALPNVDVRYHQVQIQDQTDRPAGFNFRGVSEKTIFPWLTRHTFDGAKSGWQTRTFERPKPYMLTYDENIGDIKDAFLNIFDELEEKKQSADDGLSYLIYHQIIQRETKKITLLVPSTKDINLIINLLRNHFFYSFKTKGEARLPVLALYAVYSVLIEQLERYQGMMLKPLEEHSAADSQTGAIGDIEVLKPIEDQIFEAIEVKHEQALCETFIQTAALKIAEKSVDRYYILTTHPNCEPNAEQSEQIKNIEMLYNCQLIANGVIPTLKYYLRLLTDPSKVLPKYTELLAEDKAIKHEHREVWNELAMAK